jgi:hypothetical protein
MIHLIKLAVGIRDAKHLEGAQRARAEAHGDLAIRRVHTRHRPVQPEAVEGSLYWVIQGVIRCRQRIMRFETGHDVEGKSHCMIVLEPELIMVLPTRRGPFQGWRYLDPAAAPPDLRPGLSEDPPPEAMLAELRSLGLI